MALAIFHDWEAKQLDVVTTFLEANIKEEIYMRQPKGHRQEDEHGVELVCQLQRSIYGFETSATELEQDNNCMVAVVWLHTV